MITLEELAAAHEDKVTQGFINELITDSYLLSAMTFDDCMNAHGTSTLTYGYRRVVEHSSAAFRALNAEPVKSKPRVQEFTTKLAILSSAWDMDRVAQRAAEDLYELHLEEAKNAVIRQFNKTVVNGDTTQADYANGFDGLSKALTGSTTEKTSVVDLSSVVGDTGRQSALAFASEMDGLLSGLMRTPDVLLVSPSMKVKMNAVLRVLGLNMVSRDDAGRRVDTWDGIHIEELRDGAITDDSIYAVCLGMDGFHGITLEGGAAVNVSLPDWSTPGAVKSGDAEMVVGCALKATKAAGVLRPRPAQD